jgi:tetratricopeptide (TPR) repeat protein
MVELEAPTRALVASNPDRVGWRAGLAVLLCQTGRSDEARELMAGLADGFDAVPRDGDWLITFALVADAAADLQDAEQAAIVYDLLAPYRGSNVVIGFGAVCLGPVTRSLGRLAMSMGRSDEAIEHLRAAIDSSVALRAPVHVAHARLDYAMALRAGGDSSTARTLIEQAAETAAVLELPLVAQRAESLAGIRGGLQGA